MRSQRERLLIEQAAKNTGEGGYLDTQLQNVRSDVNDIKAILQGTYFNDNGFEAVSTYSVDEFAAELRRRPPSRWTGKTPPPLPTQVQAQACPYLRFG